MKVLLLNDSSTESNWGGRAASDSLRMLIREAHGDILRTITIDQLNEGSFGRQAGPAPIARRRIPARAGLFVPPVVHSVSRRIDRYRRPRAEASAIPSCWAEYEACAARLLGPASPWPDLPAAFREAEVAVVFGDGDIYGNGLLPRSLFFFSYVLKKHFGTPVVMIDHSADLTHPELREVARHVYPLFDDVVFREPMSAEECRDFCDGKVAADTAFLFQPAPREAWAALADRPTYFDVWPHTADFRPSEPYLCVGGSSLVWDAWDPGEMTRGLLRLVDGVRATYAGQLVLTVSDVAELEVFERIAEARGLPLIGVRTPVQQAVDVVGNADAYIGGRWHPAIFALRGGTPVVGLSSKTFKMRALLGMAGLPEETYDLRDLLRGDTRVVDAVSDCLRQGDALRRRLSGWAAEMAAGCRENVAYLRTLADPAPPGGAPG
jgi:hypothetical protein